MSGTSSPGDDVAGSAAHLQVLANYRMPFGKYKDTRLMELPDEYLLWFKHKGFPPGRLGALMGEMLELKTEGLTEVLRPFRDGTP